MQFDSFIFDMDGTLWDAVDSYCAVWNATMASLGINLPEIVRNRLEPLMGKPLNEIYDALIGDAYDRNEFLKKVGEDERRLMPSLGGILYPDVKETLAELSKTHKLFMLSNCAAGGLPNFLRFTGLEQYFTDHISFGDNKLEKDANLRLLIERHTLTSPLYIGDTIGDCRSTHAAGIPFAWASWGFGKNITDADYVLTSIKDLSKL